jgi:hypothetical protein
VSKVRILYAAFIHVVNTIVLKGRRTAQVSCLSIGVYKKELFMVFLRSQKCTRSRRAKASLLGPLKTNMAEKRNRGRSLRQSGVLKGVVIKPPSLDPCSCRTRSCTGSNAKNERCGKRIRLATKRNGTKETTTHQHQQQLFGKAVLEIDHIPFPLHLRCDPRANDLDYTSRCAVNRAARIAKRRRNKKQQLTATNIGTLAVNTTTVEDKLPVNAATDEDKLPAVITKKLKLGPKFKYVPYNCSNLTNNELQQWRHENTKQRNLEATRLCSNRSKKRTKDLEDEILEYHTKHAAVQRKIEVMQRQLSILERHRQRPIIPSRYFVKFPSVITFR